MKNLINMLEYKYIQLFRALYYIEDDSSISIRATYRKRGIKNKSIYGANVNEHTLELKGFIEEISGKHCNICITDFLSARDLTEFVQQESIIFEDLYSPTL